MRDGPRIVRDVTEGIPPLPNPILPGCLQETWGARADMARHRFHGVAQLDTGGGARCGGDCPGCRDCPVRKLLRLIWQAVPELEAGTLTVGCDSAGISNCPPPWLNIHSPRLTCGHQGRQHHEPIDGPDLTWTPCRSSRCLPPMPKATFRTVGLARAQAHPDGQGRRRQSAKDHLRRTTRRRTPLTTNWRD